MCFCKKCESEQENKECCKVFDKYLKDFSKLLCAGKRICGGCKVCGKSNVCGADKENVTNNSVCGALTKVKIRTTESTCSKESTQEVLIEKKLNTDGVCESIEIDCRSKKECAEWVKWIGRVLLFATACGAFIGLMYLRKYWLY